MDKINQIKKIADDNKSFSAIATMIKNRLKDIDDSSDNPDVVNIKYVTLVYDLRTELYNKTIEFDKISKILS